MSREPGLIVALDTTDLDQAAGWARAAASAGAWVKVGLELFLSHGGAGVRRLGAPDVFLDLKLHDIPNTVAGGVRSVMPLAPRMLTVHAAGGGAMIAAARTAIDAAAPAAADVHARPLLLAVTVLTSLDAAALHATGVAGGVRQQVLRLARIALDAGADGLVCSAHEVAMLRDALGSEMALVVPGIRLAAGIDDQARTMTPGQAVAAGADWIVVGRPITRAADPAAAAAAIAAEMKAALEPA